MQFDTLPIADGTKDAVAAMGYETPTPIQRDAIPHMLAGRDVIGKAQTGTGKTAAFGIPLVDALRDKQDGVAGLILVPTRELALQVTEVLSDLARGSRLSVVSVYGGAGFGPQTEALRRRGPKVVVACPGRLLDHMGRGGLRLDDVRFLILDEADRMLDMGFIHDMRRILKALPQDRQTSLWSATITRDIHRLARDFLRDPVTVEVESPTTATTLTEQFHVRVEKSDKAGTLLGLLAAERPDKAVVFTRTKHLAKRLAQRLQTSGWSSVALQGNMTQSQRERSMDAFRSGRARVLVATDVAARGLDVPDITHVVNFDIPNEPEAYVHRIGRTGRNGRTGRSISFVQSDEHRDWRDIERVAGTRISPLEVAGGPVGPGPDPVVAAPAHDEGSRSGQRGRPGGRRYGGHGGGQGGRSRYGPPRSSGGRGGGYRGGGDRRREGGGASRGAGSPNGGARYGGGHGGGREGQSQGAGGQRSHGRRTGGPRRGSGPAGRSSQYGGNRRY